MSNEFVKFVDVYLVYIIIYNYTHIKVITNVFQKHSCLDILWMRRNEYKNNL